MKSANAPDEPPILQLRSPQDVIAAVPYLLGFHPADSLVAVGADGPQGTCAMRLDLPPDDSQLEHMADAAEHLAGLLSHHRFRHAVLVGYGAPERVAPIMASSVGLVSV